MQQLNEEPTTTFDALQSVSDIAHRTENKRNIKTELECLSKLGLSELRVKWSTLHGSDAPDCLSANMLKVAISYRLQEQASGGLSRQAQLRLKALIASPRKGSNIAAHTTLTKPGTKFLREWQNKVLEVQVLADGNFIYEGQTYSSLTIIAREITGTHQSGPKFFGLKRAKLKSMKEGRHHG
jgi:hypothetical protein